MRGTRRDRALAMAVAEPSTPTTVRLRGVLLSKSFPNPAEPIRGLFVAEHVKATSALVAWSVVAPVPCVPKALAAVLGEPYVRGTGIVDGVTVRRPRYLSAPRRLAHRFVPASIAFAAGRAFREACREVDAQFVHAHELFTGGGAARRLCSRAGLPFIVTVHGQDLYSNLGKPAWRNELERAVDDAAAIICVSHRLARDAVECLGADPARVAVVPNTFDPGRFHEMRRSREDGVRFLAVGRLVPEKGHDVLLQAFARVAAERPDARLTIVGDGVRRAALEAQAAALDVAGAVRFAGALAGDELAMELGRADVFVLPSLSEGFGVVVVEALATGMPVVATRCGGPEDIVTSDSGILVDVCDPDALANGMLEVADRLETFDAHAIARFATERFSPEAVAVRLMRVYEDVVARRPLRDAIGGRA